MELYVFCKQTIFFNTKINVFPQKICNRYFQSKILFFKLCYYLKACMCVCNIFHLELNKIKIRQLH